MVLLWSNIRAMVQELISYKAPGFRDLDLLDYPLIPPLCVEVMLDGLDRLDRLDRYIR